MTEYLLLQVFLIDHGGKCRSVLIPDAGLEPRMKRWLTLANGTREYNSLYVLGERLNASVEEQAELWAFIDDAVSRQPRRLPTGSLTFDDVPVVLPPGGSITALCQLLD